MFRCGILDSLGHYKICIFSSLFYILVVSILHQRIHVTGSSASSIEDFLQIMTPSTLIGKDFSLSACFRNVNSSLGM